ncbi:MAG: YbjN domain-containing protein [Chloroflexota bacterium]
MTGGNGANPAPLPMGAGRVDGWLRELGVPVDARAERDGVTSWDIVLDGRLRGDIQVTVILDPALAALCWVHYAPPINESFRVSYRMLLRWNDELPFVKFAISEDERPMLTTELPVAMLDRDALGTALARLVAVCDLLLLESARWLEPSGSRKGAWPPPPPRSPSPLLERYGERLGELVTSAVAADGDEPRGRGRD